MDIAKMTDEELISEFQGYYSTIYILETYGTSDLRILDALGAELDKRGYEQVQGVPNFVKVNEENE